MKFNSFIILALLAAATPAAAERSVPLDEAVRSALRNNNLLKAEQFAVQAAAAGEQAAKSRYFPRLTFEEAYSASNSPTRTFMMKLDQGRFTSGDFLISNLNNPATDSDFRTAFVLEQTIYDPAVTYGVQSAAKAREERDSSLELRREQVVLEVVASYVAVQKAGARLGVTEKGLESAREHLRLAGLRLGAGTGLKSDELRARTFLAEMEEARLRDQNALAIARLRLGKAMGAPAGEGYDSTGEIRPLALTATQEELTQAALAQRQDLRELTFRNERAELGVGQAKSRYLPTLHAGAAFQLNDKSVPFGSDNNSWYAGASLRWELFDGMQRSREQEKAGALQANAAQMVEQYRKEVAFQVAESWLRREEARKRVAVARSAVADAEEGLRLVRKRFEGALATIVELLDAQTSEMRARSMVVDAETDLLLASAQLAYSAGMLRKEIAP